MAHRPILIGLPGAGKSTVSRHLAEEFNLAVVGTDPLFRIYRAIPHDSDKDGAQVMKNFLKRAAEQYPDHFEDLKAAAKADPGDPAGRTHLRDSTLFRSFGEDVFRLFEIEMNRYLDKTGQFDGKIPDLSASALLYEENAEIFSRENGYVFILLNPHHDDMVDRLTNDYYKHVAQSEAAGELKPIRGRYERDVRQALAENTDSSLSERDIVRRTVSDISKQDKAERFEIYKSFDPVIIDVEPNDTPQDVVNKIISQVPEVVPDGYRSGSDNDRDRESRNPQAGSSPAP